MYVSVYEFLIAKQNIKFKLMLSDSIIVSTNFQSQYSVALIFKYIILILISFTDNQHTRVWT